MTRRFLRRPQHGRRAASVLAAATLLIGMSQAIPANAAPPTPAPEAGPRVYSGDLGAAELKQLRSVGIDHEDLKTTKGSKKGTTRVQVILNSSQAKELAGKGLRLTAQKESQVRAKAAPKVFRPYSGPGNIREEILKVAADHPNIAQAVTIGTSVQGQPITAIRVSKDVSKLKDGRRPAVVYQATQHAREWITPEMVRRLLHHYVNGYGRNADLTKIVDTTDLWFLPVVNVDGYDLTFQPGFRLWRKNVRDNNGDGQITSADGVDLNRNFPYKWGYDNEGSSPQPTSQTYRGPGPASEPETRAQINLYKRLKPKYLINWHSAAQLLLYGVGWQALTPSPDDLVHEAIVGDIDRPAVPGYVPQLGAQLYTTNGDTDGEAENHHHALAQTPEMATCATAAGYDPNDEWTPERCATDPGSIFGFPDDEKLINFEFGKNLNYAISVGKSAHTPDHPVSPVGRSVPDFKVDKFGVSMGGTQEVAAWIRRSLAAKHLNYRVNGGKVRRDIVREWRGGERYGRDNDTYFAEFRGKVRGQRPGDRVEAWFSGFKKGKRVDSEHFTYTVRSANKADVLVIADEDYKGINPTYPPGTNAPRYADQYVKLVREAGHRATVWDIDKDGAPHDLGVLKHFKGVVWYLGDNRLTQDAADDPVRTYAGNFPDSQVADRAKDLLLSVRSYLNEGGKLLYTGETTGYNGPLAFANGGGIYYGAKGHPERPCVITASFRDDCELLSDDFLQYWLGSYERQSVGAPTRFNGSGRPYSGTDAALAGTATNKINEAGGMLVTSDQLPPDRFPQFRSWSAGTYKDAAGQFEPIEGSWFVSGPHRDNLYRRLTRTIDLTNVTAAQAPTLQAKINYSTESGFDHVLLEAHTAGADDWTTLPDKNGRTSTNVPAECEAGYFTQTHPFLLHYLTQGNPCRNTGTTGAWNSFTGVSTGWTPVAFDLSAYAGKKVEVSFAYVSDPGSGGSGLTIDDTRVTTTGGTLDAEGFETGLGPWQIQGAPTGSPGNGVEFVRSQAQYRTAAAVATRDSVMLGFGIEQAATHADQRALMTRSIRYLLD
ncbi:M14 family metallopeptidase [Actinomadura kijaniata]|uniref:M14 family metallopeptidase n=1 Tax=Actinomadura kijaniata TaxID=46161 RepID=UPI00082C60B5|nr:M14 family metallopeptidase [Actinomadura kijaniata]